MGKGSMKKMLALFLAFSLTLSLIPGTGLSVRAEEQKETTAACTLTEGCTLEEGHEGACVTDSVDEEEKKDPENVKDPEDEETPEGAENPEDEKTPEDEKNPENAKEPEAVNSPEETETPEDEETPAEAAIRLLEALPTAEEVVAYEPETGLSVEDEGFNEAYNAAYEAYYVQIQKECTDARAAYDALSDEEKALVDAALVEKLNGLELLFNAPAKTYEVTEDDYFEVNGEGYATLADAINALTEDGQTITLLKNCSLYSYYMTGEAPHSFTLTAAEGATLTMTQYGCFEISPKNPVTVTLQNIEISFETRNNFGIGSNATLILESGTVLKGADTLIEAYGINNAGKVVMKDGAQITGTGSGTGIDLTYGLNFVMEGGKISGWSTAVMLLYGGSTGGTFVMQGGEISGNKTGVSATGGNADIQGGTITGNTTCGVRVSLSSYALSVKISGNPKITENISQKNGERNLYFSKGFQADFSELGENAVIGITLDALEKGTVPTADAPIKIAQGTSCPLGLTLDNSDKYPSYEIQSGKKLEAGGIFVVDPSSTPTQSYRGSGTENDPYLANSYEELVAAIKKINQRSQMGYIVVDGPIDYPDDSSVARPTLTGKLTLSSTGEENRIYSPLYYILKISGDVELVLKDIVFEGDPDGYDTGVVDLDGGGSATGSVTVEDGVVMRNFSSTAIGLNRTDVEITFNGGLVENCNGVAYTNGPITVNGGTYKNNGYCFEVNQQPVLLSGTAVFEGNTKDFDVDSDYYEPVTLTSSMTSPLKITVTKSRTKPFLTAENGEWLKGWEELVTVTNDELTASLAEDGLGLVIQGSTRIQLQFLRSGYSSQYGTSPVGKYCNAGTETVHMGKWWIDGISQLDYNGYDMKAVFMEVRMMDGKGNFLADFKDSEGKPLTDKDGYIINFDSVDLEYYTVWNDYVTGESGRVEGSGGVIDNIPGTAGVSGMTWMRYKGNETYMPCAVHDQFSVGPFYMVTDNSIYSPNPTLKSGVSVEVTNDKVAYTGEEVTPEIKVTVANSGLLGGQEVTLVEGRDYWMGVNEEDWEVGTNRTAYLFFTGNYYGNYYGYKVNFEVTKGTLQAEDYFVPANQKDTEVQTLDLSQLTITPVQDAFTFTLGADSSSYDNVLENVQINGSELTFQVKEGAAAGQVKIPIAIDSDNAEGTANVIVTVSDKTEGAVQLSQNGKTFYFDTLTDAMLYARDGDGIKLTGEVKEDVTIDKAVVIEGGKTAGLSGNITITAPVTIKECNASNAEITLDGEGYQAILAYNYWNGVPELPAYPYYKDEAFTQLVSDPAPAVTTALDAMDKLIYDETEDFVSLMDAKNNLDDIDMQKMLVAHKDEVIDIYQAVTEDPEALEAYLNSNAYAGARWNLFKRVYEIATQTLAAPTVSIRAEQTSAHPGETLTLEAVAVHTDPDVTFSYAWYKDGSPLSGETKAFLNVTTSGSYTVRVTADNGLVTSEEAESDAVLCTIDHQYTSDWKYDGTNHWHECSGCDQTDGLAAHTFGNWTVTKAATAKEEGSRERICSVCGFRQTESIPATGDGNGATEPTKPTDNNTPGTDTKTDENTNSSQTGSGNSSVANASVNTNSAKTGDNSQLSLWMIVLIFAVIGLTGIALYSKKRKKN